MAKNILVLFISLIISFFLLEGLSRIAMPIQYGYKYYDMAGEEKVNIKDGLFRLVPDLEYRQITQEFDARTTHTSRGFRGPDDPQNPEIVFIGDSMTYGIGLSDEQTIPHLACKQLNKACANLGIPGTSTFTQLERLEHYLEAEKLRPEKVIFMPLVMTAALMAGNDLSDNLIDLAKQNNENTAVQIHSTVSAQKNWKQTVLNQRGAILEHLNLARITYYIFGPALRAAFSPELSTDELDKALSVMKDQLVQLDRLAQKYRFSYSIVLLHPMQDIARETWPSTMVHMASIAPQANVFTTASTLRTMTKESDYYYPLDGHLNADGAALVSKYVSAVIKNKTQ